MKNGNTRPEQMGSLYSQQHRLSLKLQCRSKTTDEHCQAAEDQDLCTACSILLLPISPLCLKPAPDWLQATACRCYMVRMPRHVVSHALARYAQEGACPKLGCQLLICQAFKPRPQGESESAITIRMAHAPAYTMTGQMCIIVKLAGRVCVHSESRYTGGLTDFKRGLTLCGAAMLKTIIHPYSSLPGDVECTSRQASKQHPCQRSAWELVPLQ